MELASSKRTELRFFSPLLYTSFAPGLTALREGTSQAEQVFKAGDEVPESGVYTVRHHLHRESHSATIFRGERFPACSRCGSAVRFVLARRVTRIVEDADFQHLPRRESSSK